LLGLVILFQGVEVVMVNENFSISLRRARSFTFAEVVFLSCGLEPLKRLKQSDSCNEKIFASDGGCSEYHKSPVYFVTSSENRDLKETHNMLDEMVLGWVRGIYNHANPAIKTEHLSMHDRSHEERLHELFIDSFNRFDSAVQEILKIQMEGLKLGTDYLAIVENLQTEMLIPQYFLDDIDWLEFICKTSNRDLTGEEVETIRRASEYAVNGQSFYYYQPRDMRINKANIAAYLAANQIESVFDFGQTSLPAANVLTKPRIEKALNQNDNVKTKAARSLGVATHVLDSKINELGIHVPVSRFQNGNAKSKKVNKATPFTGL
jgi:hypothetical protein